MDNTAQTDHLRRWRECRAAVVVLRRDLRGLLLSIPQPQVNMERITASSDGPRTCHFTA